MHGNEIPVKNLHPLKNTRFESFWGYAPIIYRAAFKIYLDKNYPQKRKGSLWSSKYIEYYWQELDYEKRLLGLLEKNLTEENE